MGWLLIVIIFDIDGGHMAARQMMHKVYPSEEACNEAGRNFRSIHAIPAGVKSLSSCVDPSWYEQSGWRTEEDR